MALRRPTAQLRVLTLPNEAEENATAIVEWHCNSDHAVEIRVDGLRGALLTKAIGPGTVETGPWVKAGTSFALVETPRKGQSRRLRVLDFVTVPSQRKSIQFVEPHEVLPGTVASRLSTRSPVLSNNKWYVIPPPSSGEVFLLASYAQTFLEQYGGDEVVVVTDKRLLDVLRLFPDLRLASRELATSRSISFLTDGVFILPYESATSTASSRPFDLSRPRANAIINR